MKKVLFTFMFLCLGGMLTAQETNQNDCKYFVGDTTIYIGDTILWQPFDWCDSLSYRISGHQNISYKPVNMGEHLQIIAKHAGLTHISARRGENNLIAPVSINIIVKEHETVVIPELVKPQTQAFTGNYHFNPPTNYFFVTTYNPESDCRETYVKIGDIEAHNDGHGLDRYWNVKTGENWYYRPEAQGWTDDVKWEFDPLGKSFFPLDAFEKEVTNKSNLSKYYVGMEKVLDVNCWHFFVEEGNDVVQYWVDPTNGCTLKRQLNTDPARVVTVYDLNYRKLYFGPKFKKGLHDTTR